MSASTGISVVIPNYNGEALLPEILPTVIRALEEFVSRAEAHPALTGTACEIIVSDDCSTDGSLALLATKFPIVKVITASVNGGFSRTANRGVAAAGNDWVLLLNSDVKLEPGYFHPLMKYMNMPEVFGVMGCIIGWNDEVIQDGAKYPSFHGVKIKTSGNYLLPEEQMEAGIRSMYLSGANAFLHRERFMEIGGFNEMFSPFYVEDYELSLRAWRLGYSCWYQHTAVCRHRTSSTIGTQRKRNAVKVIYNRNKMFLHSIHLDGLTRVAWFIQLLGELLVNVIIGRFGFARSFRLFIGALPAVRQSRRELRAIAEGKGPTSPKLLSVKDVTRLILDPLNGQDVTRF